VLLVDAQGHDIISAKIASTVHDTFHAIMLADLDRNGKTTPDMFEKINLRLAESVIRMASSMAATNGSAFKFDQVVREHQGEKSKEICNAVVSYAVKQDQHLKEIGEEDRIDDKTAFVIKHK
jgi:hypothetical protein